MRNGFSGRPFETVALPGTMFVEASPATHARCQEGGPFFVGRRVAAGRGGDSATTPVTDRHEPYPCEPRPVPYPARRAAAWATASLTATRNPAYGSRSQAAAGSSHSWPSCSRAERWQSNEAGTSA